MSCLVFFCLVRSCLVLVSVVLSYLRCSVLCGVVFVVLGRFVDCSSIVFAPLGGRGWPFLVVSGASWGHLGVCFGHLARSWVVLGPSRAHKIGRPIFGPALGSIFGPSWVPRRPPKRPQDDTLTPQDAPRGGQDGAQDAQKSSKKSTEKR